MSRVFFWSAACLAALLVMTAGSLLAADFPPAEQLKPSRELPDPLTMLGGTKVTSAEQWEQQRKPELKALFQHYMYGRLPPKPAQQKYEVLFSDDKALGGKATLSEVKITFAEPKLDHAVHVLLAVPNQADKPPVFVGMNFCGNHTLLDHPQIHLPEVWMRSSCPGVENERATDQGRGGQKDVWNIDLIVDRGYALACFYSGEVDPDAADRTDGIRPAYWKDRASGPADDDGATIALWAWGFHRVVDLLHAEAADRVDVSRIAAVGHSRNGKTALLAGAFDERIALVIPHQAGCGGTAPSRTSDPRAESVTRINTSFPHWFCGNFKQFNDRTELLPFDQHCLVALCAPRPVLLSNAEEDQWANPSGQFEMLKAAEGVYKLLGSPGLAENAKPEMNKLVASPLGYFIRPGRHSMSRPDWEVFLDYADTHLKK
jgi:hypothetical protein